MTMFRSHATNLISPGTAYEAIPWAVIWGRSYLGNGTDHPRDYMTNLLTKFLGMQSLIEP
jgi:hypothetical protein